MSVWTDGATAGPVSSLSLVRSADRVPPEIAAWWRGRRQMRTPDGVVRLIDPAGLIELETVLWPRSPGAIPLFTTARGGDVVVPDGEALTTASHCRWERNDPIDNLSRQPLLNYLAFLAGTGPLPRPLAEGETERAVADATAPGPPDVPEP